MKAANSALQNELDVRRHSVLALAKVLGASNLALVKFDRSRIIREKYIFGGDHKLKWFRAYITGHELVYFLKHRLEELVKKNSMLWLLN